MQKNGFTLLEIIISISIIAVIAVGIFMAINPEQRLGDAQDCVRDATALAMQKKLDLYIADNMSTPPALESLPENTYYMLVTEGGSTAGQCPCATLDIALDRVDISGIIGDLPTDDQASGDDTGYYIYRSGNSFTIDSCNAAGDEYEVPVVACGTGHTDNGDGTCSTEISGGTADGYMDLYTCTTGATTASSKNTTWTNIVVSSGDDEESQVISRGYLYFDTSAIPAGATIDSASLKLVKTFNPLTRTITLVLQGDSSGTYPSATLALSDFNVNLYNTTDENTFTSAQMTLNSYYTHDISASGLNIIQTGDGATTKFVIRDNAEVTNSCAAVWYDFIYIASASNTGKEPKLLVTYTP